MATRADSGSNGSRNLDVLTHDPLTGD